MQALIEIIQSLWEIFQIINFTPIFFLIALGLLIVLIREKKKKPIEGIYIKTSEYLIIDHKMNILEHSKNFFYYLDLKEESISALKSYDSFFSLLEVAIRNRKSFFHRFSFLNCFVNFFKDRVVISLEINYENLFNNLPFPISVNFKSKDFSNKSFHLSESWSPIEFLTGGSFFLKHNTIYKKETTIENFSENSHGNSKGNPLNFSYFIPIMKYDEMMQIKEKFFQLPTIPICLVEKNGDILKQTQEFLYFFGKNNNSIEYINIQDFLENIRNTLLHNKIYFAEFKTHILKLINNLTSPISESYSTIDGKVIAFDFYPDGNNIYILLRDITNLSIEKSKEYIFDDICKKVVPNLSDLIVFTESNGLVSSSNCNLINSGDKINNARNILKLFINSENKIHEIKMSNDGKCLLVKNSIREKIKIVKEEVFFDLHKMIQILRLFSKSDNNFKEYLQYIDFIHINIENKIKTLECHSINNFTAQNFDLNKEIILIKSRLEYSLSFKNLEMDIPIEIIENNLKVYHQKEIICLLIENLFLIAFKYQSNPKVFRVSLGNQDDCENVYITLTQIDKQETQKIHKMFDLLRFGNIFSEIIEDGDRVNITFYFQKIVKEFPEEFPKEFSNPINEKL